MAEQAAFITIVGCGPGSADYVTPAATKAIDGADVLVGARRLLDLFPNSPGERVVVNRRLDQALDSIEAGVGSKRIAVLVTGDPGLFSFAKLVIQRFGREHCRVIPGISSVQTAFARIGLGWEDARVVSAHKEDPQLDASIAKADKIAILCGRKGSLDWICNALNNLIRPDQRVFVCENLTLENERVIETNIEDLKKIEVATSAIVIIVAEGLVI